MDPTPVALSSGLFSVLVLVDSLVAFGMLSPCYLKPRGSVLVLFLVSTFFFFFLKEECWHSSIHVKGIYLVVPTAAAMYKSTYLHNSRSCFPSEIQNNAALSIFTWMSLWKSSTWRFFNLNVFEIGLPTINTSPKLLRLLVCLLIQWFPHLPSLPG